MCLDDNNSTAAHMAIPKGSTVFARFFCVLNYYNNNNNLYFRLNMSIVITKRRKKNTTVALFENIRVQHLLCNIAYYSIITRPNLEEMHRNVRKI